MTFSGRALRRYDRLTLALPPGEEEGPLCAELWALGSLGLEWREEAGQTIVEAYFEGGSVAPPGERTTDWATRGIRVLEARTLPDEDWLATYRASARPFEVGRGWLIDPREPEGEPPIAVGRVTLRLPARRAFGTGSHESTRLVLEWMEDLSIVGRRVLDLGTGSGVLSLAAERLGAASVIGVDIDPVATIMARDNRRLNEGAFRIVAGDLDCLAGARFDLALVNIIPEAWVSAIGRLAAVLAPGAAAVFSGLLCEQLAEVTAAVEPVGLRIEASRREGEWAALLALRAGG